MISRFQKQESGFSLIEISVATAIFGIILLGLGSLAFQQNLLFVNYKAKQTKNSLSRRLFNVNGVTLKASLNEAENFFLRDCLSGIDDIDPIASPNSGHCQAWTFFDIKLTTIANSLGDNLSGTPIKPAYFDLDGKVCDPTNTGTVCYLKVTTQFQTQCPILPTISASPSAKCIGLPPKFIEVRYTITPLPTGTNSNFDFLKVDQTPVIGSIFVPI